jgi:hypothetical protein
MKQRWLDAAEVADAWRIVPRLLLLGYGYMLYDAGTWFMALEVPNGAQSAYVSILWGAAAVVSGLYFNTGRRWGDK